MMRNGASAAAQAPSPSCTNSSQLSYRGDQYFRLEVLEMVILWVNRFMKSSVRSALIPRWSQGSSTLEAYRSCLFAANSANTLPFIRPFYVQTQLNSAHTQGSTSPCTLAVLALDNVGPDRSPGGHRNRCIGCHRARRTDCHHQQARCRPFHMQMDANESCGCAGVIVTLLPCIPQRTE
jgi:hypothetical protein